MGIANWSELSAEQDIVTTGLDNKADKSTSFVADIVNTADRDLYAQFWVVFGSMTIAAGSSFRLQLRRKKGNDYADNANESSPSIEVPAGTSVIRRSNVIMRIPNAGVWGLYFINNLGQATPVSGNLITIQTWDDGFI